MPPDHIVDLGLIQVPEGRRLFSLMSVKDNLLVGAHSKAAYKVREETLNEVYRMFPRLEERQDQLALTLSGGEQQMVAIGRGLMSKPRLLMLDEPSLGLAPILIHEIFKNYPHNCGYGIDCSAGGAEDVKHSLTLSDRGYVLEHGRRSMEGPATELLDNPYVKEAYLGI